VLILKLKQAECALADGRLDETFDLLQTDSLQQHRRGQKLIGQLARALANRAQDHLDNGRLAQAGADCNKAARLAGNLPQVAKLRADLCQAMEQQQYQNQTQQAQLALAQKNFDNGRLSVGEKILADAQDNQAASLLLKEADAMRLECSAMITKIEQALKRKDNELALALLSTIEPAMVTSNEALAQLSATIKRSVADQALSHFKEGRLDLAGSLLKRLPMTEDTPSTVESLFTALDLCAQAQDAIKQGEPARALEMLQRLKLMFPSASWLKTAIAQTQVAFENLNQLRTGPIGLVDSVMAVDPCVSPNARPNTAAKPVNAPAKIQPPNPMRTESHLRMDDFIIQIDGVGSFLVLPHSEVTVGPISSSTRPTLGLLMHPNLPAITIGRDDEDYFLASKEAVRVDTADVTHKLLVDGDRITLSNKCRLKFNLPNAASTTATLVVSGARLPRPDINYVILLDHDILIGPGSNNHIRTSQLQETLILTYQDGRLFCKNAKQMMINGKQAAKSSALPTNTPVQADHVSLVITQPNDE
jgi:tetratricopeptide (TPR) repeat protein